MSYFIEHSQHLRINEGTSPNGGLRRGQVGALYAIGAHFIEKKEPAIVSLPTGYGKTALITAAGFLLKAKRILVVAPTIPLRTQAVRAFESFEVLRRLNCLPSVGELPNAAIIEVNSQLSSAESWTELESADVVICTPQSASPHIAEVQQPPVDLFDLVIMDEGHHSPAATWAALIAAFPSAKHLLFSATAFRRDRRQLPGKLVFYYPLRKAVEERAFGRVKFCPVEVDIDSVTEARDEALINKAVAVFRADHLAGYDHKIFARTDRTSAADDLATRYNSAGIRMKAISSRKSKTQIQAIIGELEAGDIDGIVCVDMLGEGYDFPRFKIAVLHVAHSSLVPTLQFIGRFARTTDQRTGDASFIAIPRDVNVESEVLYKNGVDWDSLLADVAEARQELAIKEREVLQTFLPTANPSGDYENVNPGSIQLGQHIAAYKILQKPDFSDPPEEIHTLTVCAAWASDDGNTALLLASDIRSPAWYMADHLIDARHECFLIRYYEQEHLLFICATDRSAQIYDDLLEYFANGQAEALPYEKVMRVRNGLTDQEFYNIGIRNISPATTAESYRIMAGKSADRGIHEADSSNYAQGHFMGRGKINGASVVIGASARGRMWAPGRNSVPDTMAWMDSLFSRITASALTMGKSGLDLLIFGEHIDKIPQTTCMADWGQETYDGNAYVQFMQNSEPTTAQSTYLLNLEIRDFDVSSDGSTMSFQIGDEQDHILIDFHINENPQFVVPSQASEAYVILGEGETQTFAEWLQNNPIRFFTKELNSFEGHTLWKRLPRVEIRPESLKVSQWTGCDIRVEFDTRDPQRQTVQRVLQDRLIAQQNNSFIIYDHRSGEAADFIVGEQQENSKFLISLYHCKGAGGTAPSGERVNDVYELAGQTVKSSRFQIKESLLKHIRHRTQPRRGRGHSPFLLGDRDTTIAAISACAPIDIKLEVYAVQPGLSAANLNDNVRQIIAAANDSLASQNVQLTWIVSA